MRKSIVALVAMALLTGLAADVGAATEKKKATPGLTAAEKAELRKKYMPICREQYGHKGSVQVLRVQVLSNGNVLCWYRG